MAYLRQWESSLEKAAQRWFQEPEGEIRQYLEQGTGCALRALKSLKGAQRQHLREHLAALQQGLELLAAAQQMLQGRVRALSWMDKEPLG